MKAPRSKRARRLLADPETAHKILAAARKGTPTKVEASDGNTYVVQRAPAYRPTKKAKESSFNSVTAGALRIFRTT